MLLRSPAAAPYLSDPCDCRDMIFCLLYTFVTYNQQIFYLLFKKSPLQLEYKPPMNGADHSFVKHYIPSSEKVCGTQYSLSNKPWLASK